MMIMACRFTVRQNIETGLMIKICYITQIHYIVASSLERLIYSWLFTTPWLVNLGGLSGS